MRPRIVAPPIRMDRAGHGYFGAPRGSRFHKGVDYICEPGVVVYSPVEGVISKLGFPYAGDSLWRYVQITDDLGNLHRVFYCLPLVRLDQIVQVGEVIGEAQDISQRYPDSGMLDHIHYEIITGAGEYIDPEGFT